MATGTAYITRALQRLGVIEAQETPTAEDLAYGLVQLNNLIGRWRTQRLALFTVTRHVHNLVASQASYTIGTGGNFNQVRPVFIERASVIPTPAATPAVEIPIQVLSLAQYHALGAKATTSTFPAMVYYDRSWSSALGNVIVYPVPDSNTPDLVLYVPAPLTAFAAVGTDVSFPDGYDDAIERNLALMMASAYDAMVAPEARREAREALADIKRANYQATESTFDPALTGRGADYDIVSDS